jgi:hypothetical protein
MSKTTPGLARLRASPRAEAIRNETLADQTRARRKARAKIAAAKTTELAAEAPQPARPRICPGEGNEASHGPSQARPSDRPAHARPDARRVHAGHEPRERRALP